MGALLIGFTVWAYRTLPERIPSHFDLGGRPDAWTGRGTFLVLPAIGIGTVLIILVLGRITLRNPKLVNLPDKKRFLELPETEQRWVLESVGMCMNWTATLLLVLFLVLQWSIYRSAHGVDVHTFLMGSLLVLVAALVALPIVMLVQIQRRMAAAYKRFRSGTTIPQ